jgi:hypothetical protein
MMSPKLGAINPFCLIDIDGLQTESHATGPNLAESTPVGRAENECDSGPGCRL